MRALFCYFDNFHILQHLTLPCHAKHELLQLTDAFITHFTCISRTAGLDKRHDIASQECDV